MIPNHRWKTLNLELSHLELSNGVPPLANEPGYDGVRVVFFLNGVPLGDARISAADLPLEESQVASIAAGAIAQAAGDQLFKDGFRAALPGLPPQSPDDSLEALQTLLAEEQPMARLASRATSPRSKPRATLTVAICTHERPEDLSRCLSSLAQSAEPPDEILVVDNAPASNATHDVVSQFRGVRYCYEPQRGLSAARNAALAAASGDIVAFTDDDVFVHPEWTARIRRCFGDPSVMVATGLVLPAELETPAQIIFEHSLRFFNQGYRRRHFEAEYFPSLGHRSAPVWELGAGANMAIRRKAYQLGYCFDERLGPGVFGGCGEDSEFWYRILADGWSCLYEPAACVFHYHRRGLPELRRLVAQYMRGHVAALVIQFRRYRHWGNLRRLFLELPLEYVNLLARSLASGFPLDRRILLRGWWGCWSGLRAITFRDHAR